LLVKRLTIKGEKTMLSIDGDRISFVVDNLRCDFDKLSGQPIAFESSGMIVKNKSIYIDVGCEGSTEMGIIEFDCLDNKNTWELPCIKPAETSFKEWRFIGFNENENILRMNYKAQDLEVTLSYSIVCGNICITTDIKNITKKRKVINGVAFILEDRDVSRNTTFEFPGNVPNNEFRFANVSERQIIETGLINPVIHTCTDGNHMNILFLDGEEKWGTGVYKKDEHTLQYINFAAVESYLNPGERLHCGQLFLQVLGAADPFASVRNIYSHFGWIPAPEGISDGIMYSCHPAGTMDANFPYASGIMDKDFPYHGGMREYAAELKRLKEIGIDHVWLLPIFDHRDRGVYHPTDQALIDERYGGDEAVKYFCDTAHELGMTVLFDYVPHGPAPEDELAKEHRDWCSEDRNGEPVIEWNCVSFDMVNPEYQEYTKELVKDHIRRFGIDGSRIDCAMGGLTNWKPYGDNRPSNSNLKGGVAISKAIRNAFLECGKTPVVTPENFNPLPFYYKYTDIFYDMPLYRVFCELEDAHLSSEEYVHSLTRWLKAEFLTTPKGYSKMRFLGNHDTVSWVWQKARAPKVYGVDKAKALWVLISFIDGMPMLYQGDEDPALYKGEGPVLREFFKELFYARKMYLGNQYDMEYEFTKTSVLAFNRRSGDSFRKILINFSKGEAVYITNSRIKDILYGSGELVGNKVILGGYAYVILDMEEVKN
jgi:hypothetical protein